MNVFNQLIRGGYKPESYATGGQIKTKQYQPRTFMETLQDQIAYHAAKIENLQAVRDSMTPDVQKFVEAIQKLG